MKTKYKTIWLNGDEYFWSGESKEMYGGLFYLYKRCSNSNLTRWSLKKPEEDTSEYY